MTATVHDEFGALRAQLLDLRNSLPHFQNDQKYLGLIDEFMREYEFGLALESVCDFLLEPEVPPPDSATLARVATLHRLMKVEDSCVERLRLKAGQH